MTIDPRIPTMPGRGGVLVVSLNSELFRRRVAEERGRPTHKQTRFPIRHPWLAGLTSIAASLSPAALGLFCSFGGEGGGGRGGGGRGGRGEICVRSHCDCYRVSSRPHPTPHRHPNPHPHPHPNHARSPVIDVDRWILFPLILVSLLLLWWCCALFHRIVVGISPPVGYSSHPTSYILYYKKWFHHSWLFLRHCFRAHLMIRRERSTHASFFALRYCTMYGVWLFQLAFIVFNSIFSPTCRSAMAVAGLSEG